MADMLRECPKCMLLVFASVDNICPGCGLDLGDGTPQETDSYAVNQPPVANRNVPQAELATSSEEAKSNYSSESDFDKSPPPKPEAASLELFSLLFSYRGRISRTVFVSTFLLTYSLSLFAQSALVRGVDSKQPTSILIGLGVLHYLINLFIVWFTTAISAKRLHDCNRSGWWQLAHLIPRIGTLCLVIFLVYHPGQRVGNRFGARANWP